MSTPTIPLFQDSVEKLATLVEEGARANQRSVDRFVEPANGTLRRSVSRRHHLIFGRRGSGKSSLLFKSAFDLDAKGNPVAYVDLESFKGHHYPDVLLSVLFTANTKFLAWLNSSKRLPWHRRWWRFIKTNIFFRKDREEELRQLLIANLTELIEQLHLADGAKLIDKYSAGSRDSQTRESKTNDKLKTKVFSTAVEESVAQQVEKTAQTEKQAEYIRSKRDWLHRKIIDFRNIFSLFPEVCGASSFLFLDDLYHIHREDQAQLLDYFHRIAKNNSLWLKIGTIKHRSTWYMHGAQPIGLKIGDDAEEINLDLTLEKFSVSKTFLKSVLESYITGANAPKFDDLIADGGFDRLVLASGGVTRDFLGLFRRSIDEACERLTRDPKHIRGPKIGAEDVNVAAGNYGETKRDEFKRDTLEDREALLSAFEKVRKFCLEKTKSNILLIDQDLNDGDASNVQELVDLRLLHHVRSRVTVKDRAGKIYRALLLDVSQYTGERMRRDVQIIEFWKEAAREEIRKNSLVYDPSISIGQLDSDIATESKRRSTGGTTSQPELPFP